MSRLRKQFEQSEHLAPARFGVALLLIVVSIFGFAFSGEHGWARVLALMAQGAALLFILRMSERGIVLRVARIAVIIAVGAAIVSIYIGGASSTAWPTLATTTVGAMMAIAAPIAILRRLSHEKVVDVQVVAGALCLYLLIGLFFTFVYKTIDYIDKPTPFFVQTQKANSLEITYFSFVTLTTVGYGDYTAAQDFPKMLAVSEALFGQLYLVSAVALVVSRFGGEWERPLRSSRAARAAAAQPEAAAPEEGEAPAPGAPADP
ncbi:MAG TPA: ion channel [Actinomycetota bacterium]|nr:ion channel [Actinomycetota bacterium]